MLVLLGRKEALLLCEFQWGNMMEWFHPPQRRTWHLEQDLCWSNWISACLGINVEKIWVDSGYGDKKRCTQSHWGKELGNLYNPDGCDPFASVFWGTSQRGGAPSRGELVPKAGAGAKRLSYSCTDSAAGSVGSWRMAEWFCFGTDVQRSPCCIEGNVSHCTLKYLWFQLNFFPKHIHYSWLLLPLIDLPLSIGCHEMPQIVELITLHSAPILHHSALPSSVSGIFSCPAAENLAQKWIPIPPLSSGAGT